MRPIIATAIAAALFVALAVWLSRPCEPGDAGFTLGSVHIGGCK